MDEQATTATTATEAGTTATTAVTVGASTDSIATTGVNASNSIADAAKPIETTRLFTQEELDAVVKDRVARERKGTPTKEELSAFKKWQDEQKTAEQIKNEELAKVQQAAAEAQAKLTRYEQSEAVRKAKIDESYVGYVTFEVSELSKTKDISFDEALSAFLKTNSERYAKQETRTVTVDTGAKEKEPTKPSLNMRFTGVRPHK